jgi:hypothetical protein
MRWVCAALLTVLAACASTEKMEEKVLAASPAPDSGFLENADKMAPHPERAPFDRTWWAPDFSWGHYTKMYVSAVDTHHLLSMSIWEQINIRSIDVKQDISDIALEFHQDVEKAFQNDPAHHFEILQDPKFIDDKTIVIQLALVELVPNKAALGVLGTAAWAAPLAIGVPVGTLAAFADQGSISFEGRARDGGTGEVVAMCADREIGPMRVVDFRSMTWYGSAHEIIGQWADQLVELANTPRDVQVKHSAYFTLMPW